MNSLSGYPGRGIFVGRVRDRPCFVYFVTGRSAASRKRMAIVGDHGVRIAGEGNDPLRHYDCVRISGANAFIANGSHISSMSRPMTAPLLADILKDAGPEPDSLRTLRIAGVAGHSFYLGAVGAAARAFGIRPRNNTLYGVVTYGGSVDDPKPFRFAKPLVITMDVPSPQKGALFFKKMLDPLLFVTAVCGIRDGEWSLGAVNSDKSFAGK